MYGVVRRWQADPTTLQDFAQRIPDAVPELQEIPGFVSFSVVIAADTLVSLSVFEDKTGADASTALARRYSLEQWTDLHLNPPEVIGGDVAVHAMR